MIIKTSIQKCDVRPIRYLQRKKRGGGEEEGEVQSSCMLPAIRFCVACHAITKYIVALETQVRLIISVHTWPVSFQISIIYNNLWVMI